MPLQLPWREVLCGRVATSCVILLGFPRWKFPINGMSVIVLVATYLGRRINSFSRFKKRTCEALTVICLLALETFLPEYEYRYSQPGNNKF